MLVSNPHLQITHKTGASVKVPWPLVGTGKGQPLPFLLLRWVEVGRILYFCLLKSPPPAGGFTGATDGEIMVWQPGLFSLLVLMQCVASVSDDFCQLHLVWCLQLLSLSYSQVYHLQVQSSQDTSGSDSLRVINSRWLWCTFRKAGSFPKPGLLCCF